MLEEGEGTGAGVLKNQTKNKIIFFGEGEGGG
jgi:hypothetical protein